MKRLGRDTLAVWAICAAAVGVLLGDARTAQAVGLVFVLATMVEAWAADAWRRVAKHGRDSAAHWRNVAMVASMQYVGKLNEHDERDTTGGAGAGDRAGRGG